jgi:hypothetical protein
MRWLNKKLHPLKGIEFLGMGNGEEVTNALCPMPQATGRLSLYRHLGMEFPVAFNEFTFDQIIVVVFS